MASGRLRFFCDQSGLGVMYWYTSDNSFRTEGMSSSGQRARSKGCIVRFSQCVRKTVCANMDWKIWCFAVVQAALSVISAQILNAGDTCSGSDNQWHATDRSDGFLICHSVQRKLIFHQCPQANGVQKLFDPILRQCVHPKRRAKRTPGVPRSSAVGEGCLYNTDCMSTMHCPNGLCVCLNNHVAIGRECRPMINPGQVGCDLDAQCTAVWPGTSCVDRACRCDLDTSGKPTAPVTTRDGVVCVADNSCPLPDGVISRTLQPQLSLNIDAAIGPGQCEYGSSDSSDPAASCARYVDPASTNRNYLGDLYDCIRKEPIANPTATEGICCPNRALACIQPKEVTTNPTDAETRYWFNSITGQCESFLWRNDVQASSANAFVTIEHCQLYCGSTCRHSPPQYAPSNQSPGLNNRPLRCLTGSTTNCATVSANLRFQCTTIGSEQMCCASPESICSLSGGRDYSTPGIVRPTTNYDGGYDSDGNSPPTTDVQVRFYYDIRTRTCTSFNYGGSGGNFNNFLTQQDCENFCGRTGSQICTRGSALADANGVAQRCSGQSRCPSTYECRSNVCCPTKQMICSQSKALGTGCNAASIRYWYNPRTSECESFQYLGCNGNDNNFETYSACMTYCQGAQQEPKCPQGVADRDSAGKFLTCTTPTASSISCRTGYECNFDGSIYGCCPSKSFTCTLRPNPGISCGQSTTRWYYDTISRTCTTMSYLGCDGNSNSFVSREQCQSYCAETSVCPYGGRLFPESDGRPRLCQGNTASAVIGTVSTATSRQTCPNDYFCTQITFGGGLIDACCPSRARICFEFPQSGTTCSTTTSSATNTPVSRFYYNAVLRQCQTFTFLGCDGSTNNFGSMNECRLFCGSSACELGEIARIDPSTGDVQTCNPDLPNTCTSDHACRTEPMSSRAVCCGSPDLEGFCPSTERPFLEALTARPRTCDPALIGSCPRGFLCRPNSRLEKYYCCAMRAQSSGPGECPLGQLPFREPTGAARYCSRNVALFDPICPRGYYCQGINATAGLCCGIRGGCPSTSMAQINPTTNLHLLCQPGAVNTCTPGFQCMQMLDLANVFGCCTSDNGIPEISTPPPPPTMPPLVTTVQPSTGILCPRGAPVADQFSSAGYQMCTAGNCPFGYECTSSTIGNVCCPTQRVLCLQPLVMGTTDCGRRQIKFYFDQRTGACRAFWYNGCGGNDNNFETRQQCEYCLEGMCPQGGPLINGNVVSVAFCSVQSPICGNTYECLRPVYGPTAFRICCPRAQTYCSLPSDQGSNCLAQGFRGVQRYYYDLNARQCRTFQYLGCGGNANRFATQADCILACGTQVIPAAQTQYCPAGQSVLTTPVNNAPRSCLRQTCPTGSFCRYSSFRNNYYCCIANRGDDIEEGGNESEVMTIGRSEAATGHQPLIAYIGQQVDDRSSLARRTEGILCAHTTIQFPQRPRSFWKACTARIRIKCPAEHECEYERYTLRSRCCLSEFVHLDMRKT